MKLFKKHKKKAGGIMAAFAVVAALSNPFGKSESYIKERAVMLKGKDGGFCSGVQVKAKSGQSYILSAAHCLGLASDGTVTIQKEDGSFLERRVIAEDDMADLLLIEGLPGLEGLETAPSYRGEQIRTYTHGGAMSTYRTDGTMIEDREVEIPDFSTEKEKCKGAKRTQGEVNFGFFKIQACVLKLNLTFTTALIIPGSSGGMAVDSDGALVGIASASDGRLGLFVRAQDIQRFLMPY